MMTAIRTLRLSFLLTTLALISACDGVALEGNSQPDSGQPGSQPSSTLTFSPREAMTEISNGVLLRTLASPAESQYDFDDLQVLVFGPMCAGCHTGGGLTQPSSFDFTNADASYYTLLNQASQHPQATPLVVPGKASESYLLDSLEGRQISGSRMPMRSAAVSQNLLAAIRNWIDHGAER